MHMGRICAPMDKLQPLAHPVKVQFGFEPKEEKDKPFWILVSSDRYGVSANFEGRDTVFHVEIDGRVRMLDGDKLLLNYNAKVGMKGKVGGGTVGTEGSARVIIGKEKVIAIFLGIDH